MKKACKQIRIRLYLCIFFSIVFCVGCGITNSESKRERQTVNSEYNWKTMKQTGTMELLYAKEFSVDYYEGGYSLVTIADTDKFLIVPEKAEIPQNLDEDITVLQLPLQHIYLVASSAMDMFRELDALDIIEMTGTKAADWSIPEISQMVESGKIIYSGKYSAPDYEIIMEQNCDIAIESTMIYHTPEVKEQLERLGIPVLVERSSYEAEPLGRVEWIRLYGLLSGKDEVALAFMEECTRRLETVLDYVIDDSENEKSENKKVAFFYISSNGYVNVRKSGDYISKMIGIAGGDYILAGIEPEEENALSTMNMQMETFYEQAVEADYLIYNSTVDGELNTIDQLLEKSQLLGDFKAVKEGNVWCTGKNMFQETTGTVGMIEDFYAVFSQNAEDEQQLTYLHRLQ